MTPDQEASRLKKLASAARALLSQQVGLAVGASRIVNCLTWLGRESEQKHPVFAQFLDAIPRDIPLGGARLLWSPEAMLNTDKRLAPIESEYRERLFRECVEIIRNRPVSRTPKPLRGFGSHLWRSGAGYLQRYASGEFCAESR